MPNNGSLKWCLLIVAIIALFAYHRQNRTESSWESFNRPQGLESEVQLKQNEVYTGVPVRDENLSAIMDSQQPIANQVEEIVADEFKIDSLDEFSIPNSDGNGSLPDSLADDEIVIEEFPEESELANDYMIQNEYFSNAEAMQSQAPERVADATPNQLPRVASADRSMQTNQVPPMPNMATGFGNVFNPSRPFMVPEGVQIKVVQHIEYGKSLARRGAMHGAKKEFENALRLIAQAIDYKLNTSEYSDRLFTAMIALDEADDYYFAQGENKGRVDVAAVASRHQTKIVNEQQLERMTAVDVMQAYYDYVQQQFVVCGGHTVVAGEALFCLGKLYVMQSKSLADGSLLDNAKAIVHHRAALASNNRNYKSANELAVLLAKTGRFEQSKKLLVHSLKVKQVARAWENLSYVHQQLGETQLSQLALSEYQRVLSAPPAQNRIQWVSPEQFARQSDEPAELRTAQAISQPAAAPKRSASSTNQFPLKGMLKRMF